MIALSRDARGHLAAFRHMYRQLNRPAATAALMTALRAAMRDIENDPIVGKTAPGSYPELASLDLLWVKRGRYWISYDRSGSVIAGIFFETDDIPGRAGL